MSEDKIAYTAEHDLIAQKLGVRLASTCDSADDHIMLATKVQQFIVELDTAIDIIDWVHTHLTNPDILGSVFSPALQAIKKSGNALKKVDVALKILKVGHYTMNNMIVHQEQKILDDHYYGSHPPHEGAEATAKMYGDNIPSAFINAEMAYYHNAGLLYQQYAHHAVDIINSNVKAVMGVDPATSAGSDRPIYDALGNKIPWDNLDKLYTQIEKKFGKKIADEILQRIGLALGVDYSWGAAGSWTGEQHGIIYNEADGYYDDRKIWGYDCGGLMTYITDPTGYELNPGTPNQYTQLEKHGQLYSIHSISDLRPGDLLYWGPNGSKHVAMYLGTDAQGNPLILESPQDNKTVHIIPLTLENFNKATKNNHGQITIGRIL